MGLRAATAALPIQAKPARVGPRMAPSPAAGFRPNAVAANGAILPSRSLAQVSVQRKPGPISPVQAAAPTNGGPGILLVPHRRVLQCMDSPPQVVKKNAVRDKVEQSLATVLSKIDWTAGDSLSQVRPKIDQIWNQLGANAANADEAHGWITSYLRDWDMAYSGPANTGSSQQVPSSETKGSSNGPASTLTSPQTSSSEKKKTKKARGH